MKISVVIPCYNCENYIEETINSVLNQSHNDIQIICVDNNSTDSTLNIIKEYKSKYRNIEFYSEHKAGANYARNLGLSKAQGKYIQFLDADDVITQDKLLLQSEYLERNDFDIVVSDRVVYDNKLEHEISKLEFSSIISSPLPTSVSEIIITGNPLYKTEFVKKIGGYLPELKSAQDWELHIRVFLNKPNFGYLKGEFLHSRTLENSLSNKDYISVSNDACEVIRMYKNDLIKNKIELNYKAYRKIIFTYFISYINTNDSKFYKNEFIYWYKLNNGKTAFNSFNKCLISIFGIKLFLKLKIISKYS